MTVHIPLLPHISPTPPRNPRVAPGPGLTTLLAALVTIGIILASAVPAQSQSVPVADTLVPAGPIETVARFDARTPPGNIAVTPEGRIFLSLHQFWGAEHRIVELLWHGGTRPYPSEAWASAPEGAVGLSSVLGIQADRRGRLWMLDAGAEGQAPKLVAWDTRAERLDRVIPLPPPATVPGSFVNDLAVDLTHGAVYIADPAGEASALIVVDIETGLARRVLQGSRFTVPEDINLRVDGEVVELGGAPARIGMNPITLTPDDTTLIWDAMNGTALYAAPTTALNDPALDDDALEDAIRLYGKKSVSDGITVDAEGRIYITNINDDQIGVTAPGRNYEVLYQASDLSWPDGMAMGHDGQIYMTINELHRSPVLGDGESQGEFRVVRFPALGPTVPGR